MHKVSHILTAPIRIAQTALSWTVTASKVTLVALPALFIAYQLYQAAKNHFSPPHKGALVPLTLPPVAGDQPPAPPPTPMKAGKSIKPVIRPLSPRHQGSPRIYKPIEKRKLPPSQLRQEIVFSPGTPTSDPSGSKTPIQTKTLLAASPFRERVANLSAFLSPDSTDPFNVDAFLRTPQSPGPAFIFRMTYPGTPVPASPKVNDDPSYLTDLITWVWQRMENPLHLKDRPIKMVCDDKTVQVTEELLACLESFFKDYEPTQTFNDGDPYLLCHFLEKHAKKQLFLTVHPNDRARIETLLSNYKTAQTANPSDCNFYLDYPITHVRASEVKAAVDDFLATKNKIHWLVENQSTDIFYWCYQLEKNKVFHDVLKSYEKAREIIFNTPALSQFFYIDPFEVTLNNKKIIVDAEQLLEMRDLSDSIKKNGVADISDEQSFLYYASILEIFSDNWRQYEQRPEYTLIGGLIQSFRQHKRSFDRINQQDSRSTSAALDQISLPRNHSTLEEISNLFDMTLYKTFLAGQRSLKSDKSSECYSFQELAIEHRNDEDVVEELQEVHAFFNTLSLIPDAEVPQWLADAAMSERHIDMLPFYKAFLLSFPHNNHDNIPVEGKRYISSIIRKYIKSYSRLKGILGEGVEVKVPNSDQITKIYLTDFFQEGLKQFIKQ